MGGQKKLYHMKFKSKISYLGEKISILPWQMAEQLSVEVNVKNVTEILQKVPLLKSIFGPLGPLGGQKKCTT